MADCDQAHQPESEQRNAARFGYSHEIYVAREARINDPGPEQALADIDIDCGDIDANGHQIGCAVDPEANQIAHVDADRASS